MIESRYIELRVNAPESEHSHEFLQGMLDRMAMSFHKYGKVADGFPHNVDALKSLRDRLRKYDETGNTEFLMDAANFAMIEFMYPARPDAFYQATDADQSPGRVSAFTGRATEARNTDIPAETDAA